MKTEIAAKTITVKDQNHLIGDLMRRNYALEVLADRLFDSDPDLWQRRPQVYSNSTDANAALAALTAQGLAARLVVVEVTDVPKKAFWELWRTKAGKTALKAAGVFILKGANGQFVVSDTPPSKTFWKKYRSWDSISSSEMLDGDVVLKEAIQNGDGPGSETEKEGLRTYREYMGVRPSAKYAPDPSNTEGLKPGDKYFRE